MLIRADFHIHSTVSPCADLSMSPRNIIKKAKIQDLNVLALTDHNSAKNCAPFYNLCQKENIFPLLGIEVTTREEFHLLCLFDTVAKAMELSDYLYAHLPNIKNNSKIFGDQVYINEKDEILGFIDKYLGNATTLSLADLEKFTLDREGILIPSHIDRRMFSIISQLGILPKAHFSALEIYRSNKPAIEINTDYPIISNSDAHYLEDIGKVYNQFEIADFSLLSLKTFFQKKDKANLKIVLK